MKHLCKTLAMLLLTVLVGLSGLTAYAHDVPDESKKGSVTVDFEYDNKAVTGGRLALYRIAEARQTDGNYGFENLPEFSGFHKDMSDLTSAELARCLADFVDSHSIQPVDARDNRSGSVTFPELPHGLYLVVQVEAAPGYEAVQPFLVTVPMLEDGRYVYDVNAYGKTALQKTKTDPVRYGPVRYGSVRYGSCRYDPCRWPAPDRAAELAHPCAGSDRLCTDTDWPGLPP